MKIKEMIGRDEWKKKKQERERLKKDSRKRSEYPVYIERETKSKNEGKLR